MDIDRKQPPMKRNKLMRTMIASLLVVFAMTSVNAETPLQFERGAGTFDGTWKPSNIVEMN
jgi:hypothetical protein